MDNRKEDEKYMRRCIQLARGGTGTTRPNPMVGAVIVHDGTIIGEGYHIRCGEGHAEVNAFASVKPDNERLLPSSTLYVSLEPCAHYGKTPPCANLIISKGVKRVVVGCVDVFAKVHGRGIDMLRHAGITVDVGVLEDDCRNLNKRFFSFHSRHRPHVTLKWAQTANGFIDDNFRPTALSTPLTAMLCHKMRAESDAILVGRVTDERDKPRLDVRHWTGKNPRRIALGHHTDIAALLNGLYDDGVQSLLVEGGAKTHAAFFNCNLWDEARVETAPMTVNGGTRAAALPGNVTLLSVRDYDGNRIETYANTSPA